MLDVLVSDGFQLCEDLDFIVQEFVSQPVKQVDFVEKGRVQALPAFEGILYVVVFL